MTDYERSERTGVLEAEAALAEGETRTLDVREAIERARDAWEAWRWEAEPPVWRGYRAGYVAEILER